MIEDEYREARRVLAGAGSVCALTGAGISAACGLGVFRGAQAADAEEDRDYLQWSTFRRDPAGCWPALFQRFYQPLAAAEPSRAHRLLASWGEQLRAVVTQNVDGLHQAAGSPQVIELHGSLHKTFCWRCRRAARYQRGDWSIEPPRCGGCGKPVKPNMVFYGEQVPQAAFDAARWVCMTADVLLLIGTSCEVFPAALLPGICRAAGGVVIEINPAASALERSQVDIALRSEADEALARLLDA